MKNLGDATVRRSIEDRVSRLEAGRKGLWGRMSAHQMICHLTDSFLTSFGEKQVSPATGVLQKSLMKWFAIYAPIRWPKNIATRPEVEQGKGGTLPASFDEDKEKLLCVLNRFCQRTDRPEHPHPIFGKMTEKEWLRWGYLHVDHHLREFGA
ncbi:MAG TPA: DUF1569 domain-containing protein [Bryobacteraceae bacterium]|nr:DUF1569 domain-containing protein [Bryobacteraceae bacterium]